MIRADVRAEPPVGHGEVVGKESVVDPDSIRDPGGPATLASKAESTITKPRGFEEPPKMRRAVGAIEVADDQRRSALPLDDGGQGLELAAYG